MGPEWIILGAWAAYCAMAAAICKSEAEVEKAKAEAKAKNQISKED